jgi:hypothetical protein
MQSGGGGQKGRKNERKKVRSDNKNLGKDKYREKKTETKRKKDLDTCKARVASTCIT